MSWKLYEGDCLEVMPTLPDDTFDLIILDPPYNIGKDTWDKFPSHDEYLIFIEKVLKESERVLKDNGSLYLWHNQFPVLSDFQWLIKEKTDLIFKQMLVWEKFQTNKQYYGRNFLMGFNNENKRNYHLMAEYLLFYTFQDETGLEQILPLCFEPYLNYMTSQKELIRWDINEFNTFLNYKSIASHWFWQDKEQTKQPQPRFISQNDYLKLQGTGFFQREYEDLRKEYEDLRKEYEDLRKEYEDLRYTFNMEKDTSTVFLYPPERKEGHLTPKSIPLTKRIINHSSNVNDNVLIPFAGSGSEMIASLNLNRNVIGIEQNPQYCQIIKDRLSELNIEEQPHEGQKVLTAF